MHHMINHKRVSVGVCRSGSNGQTPLPAQNNLTATDLPATLHTSTTSHKAFTNSRIYKLTIQRLTADTYHHG
jgi:hypothetical protein